MVLVLRKLERELGIGSLHDMLTLKKSYSFDDENVCQNFGKTEYAADVNETIRTEKNIVRWAKN